VRFAPRARAILDDELLAELLREPGLISASSLEERIALMTPLRTKMIEDMRLAGLQNLALVERGITPDAASWT
jgi:hypothetical protein